MNAAEAVDASEHYEVHHVDEIPSLLAVVVDTNPSAWALLRDVLPISKAIANILIYVNAHLALSNLNQVAIIAAHAHRARWLYPSPPNPRPRKDAAGDVEMADAAATSRNSRTRAAAAKKLPQFAHIESAVLDSLQALIRETSPAEVASTTTTLVSGALTLALAHINKVREAALGAGFAERSAAAASVERGPLPPGAGGQPGSTAIPAGAGNVGAAAAVRARILVVSVSDSSASQYIPTMNAVFAASHASVPVDVVALRGNASFLQQGSYITGGNFIHAKEPRGLLTYLMTGFPVGGGAVSDMLIGPGTESVDFRAACFCHRKALDTGFVCSVCLSIFCEAPPENECLTCGSALALGAYGAKPAVVPRARKKKKRKGVNGDVRDSTGTPAGTPRPG
ncbi:hypothetical protein RB601_003854 [Gaeumannomyces tritici]